jgi:hypothetical protein
LTIRLSVEVGRPGMVFGTLAALHNSAVEFLRFAL